jgi:outer membrane protein assembly factor BamB
LTVYAESYGEMSCVTDDMQVLWSVKLEEPDGGIDACFSSPVVFPETPKEIKDGDFAAEAAKLGDENFETRELASNNLKVMGSAIAKRLRKLAESTGDPEVRNRAMGILEEMLDKPLVIIGHSWWGDNDGISAVAPEGRKWRLSTKARVSATAAVGRVLKDSKEQQIVIGVEDGRLLVISREGKILAEFKAGGSIECSACLSDIDKDGKIEIIVGDRNGFVYCFDTDSDGPVTWGQFRGNNMNTGVFEQPAAGK